VVAVSQGNDQYLSRNMLSSLSIQVREFITSKINKRLIARTMDHHHGGMFTPQVSLEVVAKTGVSQTDESGIEVFFPKDHASDMSLFPIGKLLHIIFGPLQKRLIILLFVCRDRLKLICKHRVFRSHQLIVTQG